MRTYHDFVVTYFGRQMKEKRLELKYSQAQMAGILDVSERMYGNYERGESACSVVALSHFANFVSEEEWSALYKGFQDVFQCWEKEQKEEEERKLEVKKSRRKTWKCQN